MRRRVDAPRKDIGLDIGRSHSSGETVPATALIAPRSSSGSARTGNQVHRQQERHAGTSNRIDLEAQGDAPGDEANVGARRPALLEPHTIRFSGNRSENREGRPRPQPKSRTASRPFPYVGRVVFAPPAIGRKIVAPAALRAVPPGREVAGGLAAANPHAPLKLRGVDRKPWNRARPPRGWRRAPQATSAPRPPPRSRVRLPQPGDFVVAGVDQGGSASSGGGGPQQQIRPASETSVAATANRSLPAGQRSNAPCRTKPQRPDRPKAVARSHAYHRSA